MASKQRTRIPVIQVMDTGVRAGGIIAQGAEGLARVIGGVASESLERQRKHEAAVTAGETKLLRNPDGDLVAPPRQQDKHFPSLFDIEYDAMMANKFVTESVQVADRALNTLHTENVLDPAGFAAGAQAYISEMASQMPAEIRDAYRTKVGTTANQHFNAITNARAKFDFEEAAAVHSQQITDSLNQVRQLAGVNDDAAGLKGIETHTLIQAGRAQNFYDAAGAELLSRKIVVAGLMGQTQVQVETAVSGEMDPDTIKAKAKVAADAAYDSWTKGQIEAIGGPDAARALTDDIMKMGMYEQEAAAGIFLADQAALRRDISARHWSEVQAAEQNGNYDIISTPDLSDLDMRDPNNVGFTQAFTQKAAAYQDEEQRLHVEWNEVVQQAAPSFLVAGEGDTRIPGMEALMNKYGLTGTFKPLPDGGGMYMPTDLVDDPQQRSLVTRGGRKVYITQMRKLIGELNSRASDSNKELSDIGTQFGIYENQVVLQEEAIRAAQKGKDDKDKMAEHMIVLEARRMAAEHMSPAKPSSTQKKEFQRWLVAKYGIADQGRFTPINASHPHIDEIEQAMDTARRLPEFVVDSLRVVIDNIRNNEPENTWSPEEQWAYGYYRERMNTGLIHWGDDNYLGNNQTVLRNYSGGLSPSEAAKDNAHWRSLNENALKAFLLEEYKIQQSGWVIDEQIEAALAPIIANDPSISVEDAAVQAMNTLEGMGWGRTFVSSPDAGIWPRAKAFFFDQPAPGGYRQWAVESALDKSTRDNMSDALRWQFEHDFIVDRVKDHGKALGVFSDDYEIVPGRNVWIEHSYALTPGSDAWWSGQRGVRKDKQVMARITYLTKRGERRSIDAVNVSEWAAGWIRERDYLARRRGKFSVETRRASAAVNVQ